jgi:hypothetical protein
MRDFVDNELYIPAGGNNWFVQNTKIQQPFPVGPYSGYFADTSSVPLVRINPNHAFIHRRTYAYIYTSFLNFGTLEAQIHFIRNGTIQLKVPLNFLITGNLGAQALTPYTQSLACAPLWGGNPIENSVSFGLWKNYANGGVNPEPAVAILQPFVTDFAVDEIRIQFVRLFSDQNPNVLVARFYLLSVAV